MSFDENDFFDQEKAFAKDRLGKLVNDPYFFASTKNWSKLSLEERRDFIQHFARVSANALDVVNPMVKTYSEPKDEKSGGVACGLFRPEGEYGEPTLYINEHSDALQNFDQLVDTIVHENTHYRQFVLQNDKSNIERAAFLSKERNNYIAPETNFEKYQNQFRERHARCFGETAAFLGAKLTNTKRAICLDDSYGKKLEQDFVNGRISTTGPNMVTLTDPRAHSFRALHIEKELGRATNGHANDPKWSELISHCEKALRFGEYASGFDSGVPLSLLSKIVTDKTCLESSQQRIAPERHKEKAKEIIKKCLSSSNDTARIYAKNALNSIETFEQRSKQHPTHPTRYQRPNNYAAKPFNR